MVVALLPLLSFGLKCPEGSTLLRKITDKHALLETVGGWCGTPPPEVGSWIHNDYYDYGNDVELSYEGEGAILYFTYYHDDSCIDNKDSSKVIAGPESLKTT